MATPVRHRILWLAAADARGHLMRAHVVRGLLAPAGIAVDIVTTSAEGVAFLAAIGTPARLLSTDYRIAFDGLQNMDRRATDRCILSYLVRPGGFLHDLGALETLAASSHLVVNDFHPALLLAPLLAPKLGRVVHVYGTNLWGAIEGNFAGRGPRFLGRTYARLARAVRGRAFGRIEHSLDVEPEGAPERTGPRDYRLPPIIRRPERAPVLARAALGVGRDQPLAAVYLNPHFRDPALADAIERTLAARGVRMYAVGEGYPGRPGWLTSDAHFTDVAAAADMLISAPGMGTLTQARYFGTPYLALATDQPEQERNLAFLDRRGAPPWRVVDLDVPAAGIERRLRAAVADLAAAPRRRIRPDLVARSEQAWIRTFTELLQEEPTCPTIVRPELPWFSRRIISGAETPSLPSPA